ncbi:hypothetical protein Poli38472_010970 [Pythium oligandrum]|uniref:RING-type domain-containing protein n=1 Tax=Pythium oligandrum TaxID=41045 RepID=A0A8K1FJK5_PYTOL|nr:hypothetical protein Poli38472_010970 [Pythium oligandrum]|eukprot:TMW61907.1 hypothetical protein Poli38472_010970 [Pythium oligandrum]
MSQEQALRLRSQPTLPPIQDGCEANTVSMGTGCASSMPSSSRTRSFTAQNEAAQAQNQESDSPMYVLKDYDSLRSFTRRGDGSYPTESKCLMCKLQPITTIFYPCQHKCVCNTCLRDYSIGEYGLSNPPVRTTCPLCLTTIRLLLPHNGREEELYWQWISKVEPVLPMLYPDNGALRSRSESGKHVGGPSPPRARRASAPVSPRKFQRRIIKLQEEESVVPDDQMRTASDGVLLRTRVVSEESYRRSSSACTML